MNRNASVSGAIRSNVRSVNVPTFIPPQTYQPEQGLRSILRKMQCNDMQVFTEAQIDLLIQLIYYPTDPPTPRNMLDSDDKQLIYDIGMACIEYTFDVVYQQLTSIVYFDKRSIVFDLPTMRKARNQTLQNSEIFRQKMEVGQGLECIRCKGHNTIFIDVQTRSGDEPMTTIVTCNDCGRKWRIG